MVCGKLICPIVRFCQFYFMLPLVTNEMSFFVRITNTVHKKIDRRKQHLIKNLFKKQINNQGMRKIF